MLPRSKRDDPFDLRLFQHTQLEHGQQNPLGHPLGRDPGVVLL